LDSFLANSAALNITAESLAPVDYTFSVLITDGSRSSNFSTVISVVQDSIPTVMVSSSYSSGKVNADTTIILEGWLWLRYAVGATSSWSLEGTSSGFKNNGELADVTLTSLTKSLDNSGEFYHYLVLDGSYLVTGGTYKFIFSSNYDGSEASSFSQIELTVNSPPTSGKITVTPRSGYSIQDEFTLQTTDWTDDAEDFPLKYSFHYLSSSSVLTLLRGSETGNTFEGTQLPKGSGDNNTLSIGVIASDKYGSKASAYTSASVYPYTASLDEAGEAAAAMVTSLLGESNSAAVYSTVQNFASFLAATNCTLAPDCAKLNRISCDSGDTDHTCGSCLGGFSGSKVDFSSGCYLPGESCTNGVYDSTAETDVDCGATCDPCAVGFSCIYPSDCTYNLCEDGICGIPSKSCQQNCNGHGTCSFDGPNSVILTEAECTINNPFCTPTCYCTEGFYGDYCAMDQKAYDAAQALVATLLDATLSAVGQSDLTSDSIDYMASTFTSLASDVTLIKAEQQASLLNTTGSTISASYELGEYKETATDQLTSILGTMLGTDLVADSENVDIITSGVSNVAESMLSSLVAGQDPISKTTDSIKIAASVYDFSVAGEAASINVELTEDEIAAGRSAPQADLGESFAGLTDLQVSLGEFSTNPYAAADSSLNTSTSSSVVRLGLGGISEGTRRRLSEDTLNFTLVLQNYFDADYSETQLFEVEGYCGENDYNTKQVLCGNSTVEYTCEGFEVVKHLTCTEGGQLPRCNIWTGADWDSDACRVQSFNATATVCQCSIDSTARRRLARRRLKKKKKKADSTGGSQAFDVASDVSSIGNELGANFAQAEEVFTNPAVIAQNFEVFSVMGSLLFGVPMLAFMGHLYQKHKEKKNLESCKEEEEEEVKSIAPDDIADIPVSPSDGHKMVHRLSRRGSILRRVSTGGKSFRNKLMKKKMFGKTGESLVIFKAVWLETWEWIQIVDQHDTGYDRIVTTVTLMTALFTFMFWDATLTPVFNPVAEESGSSWIWLNDSFNSTSSESSSWSFTSSNGSSSSSPSEVDFVEETTVGLYISMYALVICTPIMMFLEWFFAKTVCIPYPEDKENEEHSDEEDDDNESEGIATDKDTWHPNTFFRYVASQKSQSSTPADGKSHEGERESSTDHSDHGWHPQNFLHFMHPQSNPERINTPAADEVIVECQHHNSTTDLTELQNQSPIIHVSNQIESVCSTPRTENESYDKTPMRISYYRASSKNFAATMRPDIVSKQGNMDCGETSLGTVSEIKPQGVGLFKNIMPTSKWKNKNDVSQPDSRVPFSYGRRTVPKLVTDQSETTCSTPRTEDEVYDVPAKIGFYHANSKRFMSKSKGEQECGHSKEKEENQDFAGTNESILHDGETALRLTGAGFGNQKGLNESKYPKGYGRRKVPELPSISDESSDRRTPETSTSHASEGRNSEHSLDLMKGQGSRYNPNTDKTPLRIGYYHGSSKNFAAKMRREDPQQESPDWEGASLGTTAPVSKTNGSGFFKNLISTRQGSHKIKGANESIHSMRSCRRKASECTLFPDESGDERTLETSSSEISDTWYQQLASDMFESQASGHHHFSGVASSRHSSDVSETFEKHTACSMDLSDPEQPRMNKAEVQNNDDNVPKVLSAELSSSALVKLFSASNLLPKIDEINEETDHGLDKASNIDQDNKERTLLTKALTKMLAFKQLDFELDDENEEKIIRAKADQLLQEMREKEPSKCNFMCWQNSQEEIQQKEMMQRVITSQKIEDKVMERLESCQEFEADLIILNAVRRDCASYLEVRSKRYYTEARAEVIEDANDLEWEEVEEEEEEDHGLSYRQVKIRHVLGWTFIALYNVISAFYVCLFGIRYGPEYSKTWLNGFFVGFFEDMFLMVPLKLILVFYVLPALYPSKLDIQKVRALPDYSPSVIVAKKFPNLPSSRLVLDRENQNTKTIKEQELFDKLFMKKTNCFYLMVLSLLASIIRFAAFIILILPDWYQDLAIDTFLPMGFGYFLILLMNMSSAISIDEPSAFWAFVAICWIVSCTLGVLFILRKSIKKRVKEKFQKLISCAKKS